MEWKKHEWTQKKQTLIINLTKIKQINNEKKLKKNPNEYKQT